MRGNRLLARESLISLSKTAALALRHKPWEFELELDDEGWVDIDELIEAIAEAPRWKELNREVFDRMIEEVNEGRLEISNNRVRARYGHSFPGRISREASVPPDILYHGTDKRFLDKILVEGLKPGQRHHVHLSTTRRKAIEVAKRKGNNPVILVIKTTPLVEQGIQFYPGSEQVWLVDRLAAEMFETEG
jgi:putative RNA 2'-phosphotransferase